MTLGLSVPTLDIFACGGESPFAAPAAVTALLSAGDEAQAPLHDDGDGACLHGHCHHVFAQVQLAVETGPAFAVMPHERIAAFDRPAPTGSSIKLLRPPRA